MRWCQFKLGVLLLAAASIFCTKADHVAEKPIEVTEQSLNIFTNPDEVTEFKDGVQQSMYLPYEPVSDTAYWDSIYGTDDIPEFDTPPEIQGDTIMLKSIDEEVDSLDDVAFPFTKRSTDPENLSRIENDQETIDHQWNINGKRSNLKVQTYRDDRSYRRNPFSPDYYEDQENPRFARQFESDSTIVHPERNFRNDFDLHDFENTQVMRERNRPMRTVPLGIYSHHTKHVPWLIAPQTSYRSGAASAKAFAGSSRSNGGSSFVDDIGEKSDAFAKSEASSSGTIIIGGPRASSGTNPVTESSKYYILDGSDSSKLTSSSTASAISGESGKSISNYGYRRNMQLRPKHGTTHSHGGNLHKLSINQPGCGCSKKMLIEDQGSSIVFDKKTNIKQMIDRQSTISSAHASASSRVNLNQAASAGSAYSGVKQNLELEAGQLNDLSVSQASASATVVNEQESRTGISGTIGTQEAVSQSIHESAQASAASEHHESISGSVTDRSQISSVNEGSVIPFAKDSVHLGSSIATGAASAVVTDVLDRASSQTIGIKKNVLSGSPCASDVISGSELSRSSSSASAISVSDKITTSNQEVVGSNAQSTAYVVDDVKSGMMNEESIINSATATGQVVQEHQEFDSAGQTILDSEVNTVAEAGSAANHVAESSAHAAGSVLVESAPTFVKPTSALIDSHRAVIAPHSVLINPVPAIVGGAVSSATSAVDSLANVAHKILRAKEGVINNIVHTPEYVIIDSDLVGDDGCDENHVDVIVDDVIREEPYPVNLPAHPGQYIGYNQRIGTATATNTFIGSNVRTGGQAQTALLTGKNFISSADASSRVSVASSAAAVDSAATANQVIIDNNLRSADVAESIAQSNAVAGSASAVGNSKICLGSAAHSVAAASATAAAATEASAGTSAHSLTKASASAVENSKISLGSATHSFAAASATAAAATEASAGTSAHSLTKASASAVENSKISLGSATHSFAAASATAAAATEASAGTSAHSLTKASASAVENSKICLGSAAHSVAAASATAVGASEVSAGTSAHSSTKASASAVENSKISLGSATHSFAAASATAAAAKEASAGTSAHSLTKASASAAENSKISLGSATHSFAAASATAAAASEASAGTSVHSSTKTSASAVENSKISLGSATHSFAAASATAAAASEASAGTSVHSSTKASASAVETSATSVESALTSSAHIASTEQRIVNDYTCDGHSVNVGTGAIVRAKGNTATHSTAENVQQIHSSAMSQKTHVTESLASSASATSQVVEEHNHPVHVSNVESYEDTGSFNIQHGTVFGAAGAASATSSAVTGLTQSVVQNTEQIVTNQHSAIANSHASINAQERSATASVQGTTGSSARAKSEIISANQGLVQSGVEVGHVIVNANSAIVGANACKCSSNLADQAVIRGSNLHTGGHVNFNSGLTNVHSHAIGPISEVSSQSTQIKQERVQSAAHSVSESMSSQSAASASASASSAIIDQSISSSAGGVKGHTIQLDDDYDVDSADLIYLNHGSGNSQSQSHSQSFASAHSSANSNVQSSNQADHKLTQINNGFVQSAAHSVSEGMSSQSAATASASASSAIIDQSISSSAGGVKGHTIQLDDDYDVDSADLIYLNHGSGNSQSQSRSQSFASAHSSANSNVQSSNQADHKLTQINNGFVQSAAHSGSEGMSSQSAATASASASSAIIDQSISSSTGGVKGHTIQLDDDCDVDSADLIYSNHGSDNSQSQSHSQTFASANSVISNAQSSSQAIANTKTEQINVASAASASSQVVASNQNLIQSEVQSHGTIAGSNANVITSSTNINAPFNVIDESIVGRHTGINSNVQISSSLGHANSVANSVASSVTGSSVNSIAEADSRVSTTKSVIDSTVGNVNQFVIGSQAVDDNDYLSASAPTVQEADIVINSESGIVKAASSSSSSIQSGSSVIESSSSVSGVSSLSAQSDVAASAKSAAAASAQNEVRVNSGSAHAHSATATRAGISQLDRNLYAGAKVSQRNDHATRAHGHNHGRISIQKTKVPMREIYIIENDPRNMHPVNAEIYGDLCDGELEEEADDDILESAIDKGSKLVERVINDAAIEYNMNENTGCKEKIIDLAVKTVKKLVSNVASEAARKISYAEAARANSELENDKSSISNSGFDYADMGGNEKCPIRGNWKQKNLHHYDWYHNKPRSYRNREQIPHYNDNSNRFVAEKRNRYHNERGINRQDGDAIKHKFLDNLYFDGKIHHFEFLNEKLIPRESQMDNSKLYNLNLYDNTRFINLDLNCSDVSMSMTPECKRLDYSLKSPNEGNPIPLRFIKTHLTQGHDLALGMHNRARWLVSGGFQPKPHTGSMLHFLNNKVEDSIVKIHEESELTLFAAKLLQDRLSKEYDFTPNTLFEFLHNHGFRVTGSGICQTRPKRCSSFAKYRSYDGSCNNFRNPRWGQANTAFTRVVPPRYSDGIHKIPVSVTGDELPNVRELSAQLFPHRNISNADFTLAVVQWGQVLSHDFAHQIMDQTIGGGIECCSSDGHGELPKSLQHHSCMPIVLSSRDKFYSKYGQRCMNFVRSMTVSKDDCTLGPAEQLNGATSYLDCSPMYGSDKNTCDSLRVFHGGLMKTEIRQGRSMMPTTNDRSSFCDIRLPTEVCYKGGDVRVNQNPHLVILQTLLVREHNRVARELSKLNRHWSDEQIFEETRKIVIAEYQHITYHEWLPIVLGKQYCKKHRLIPIESRMSTDYNSRVNPAAINGFATAAFRFFHSMVDGNLDLCPMDRSIAHSLRLSNHYLRPQIIEHSNNFDDLVRGLVTQPMMAADRFFDSELTKYLFRSRNEYGLDLEAIDIQRSRDHGLPGYNAYREICKLRHAEDFDDLIGEIPRENIEKLRNIYAHVDDIDLLVGGSMETPITGGILGPTIRCLVSEQFYRSRVSDRYFYDNANFPHSFTEEQYQEIKKVSLARLICDTSDDLKVIQYHAFKTISWKNPLISCGDIPKLNLTAWQE